MPRLPKKYLSNAFVLAVYWLGLEALIYIVNLNQLTVFIELAFFLYFWVLVHITLLYDLHYKREKLASLSQFWSTNNFRDFFHSLWKRIEHLRRWSYLRHWQNYLILPGLIFWTTVTLLYLNIGRISLQQLYVTAAAAAFALIYSHLTDVFREKNEKINNYAFVVFSAVKLYAAFLTFAVSVGLVRRYCLPVDLFVLGMFGLTALMMYQALFQHNFLQLRALLMALVLAALVAAASYWVLLYWGYNYFTAGVFLMAVYNMLWSILHQYLENSLTFSGVVESVIINGLVMAMAIGVTNFRAEILDACY